MDFPGRYNAIDDNRADFLVVWGQAIREHYRQAGADPAKIIVSGHSELSQSAATTLRHDTKKILVITKSMSGGQPITGRTVVSDRSDSILYLYLVQDALKSLGVARARFRAYPSENVSWYERYLDPGFYHADTLPLTESFRQTILVIGPTSTVFLNALVTGVNYLVFEPTRGGLDLLGYPFVPPFDHSDDRLRIAHDSGQLAKLIRGRELVDVGILTDYVGTSFDLTRVQSIIG
jgi:hypothetical protein